MTLAISPVIGNGPEPNDAAPAGAFAFDALVTNPGRLRILTALAAAPGGTQGFVRLRFQTRLTDGNLATHARRLTSAGLVAVDKSFQEGKPVTTLAITSRGRAALRAHVETLMSALRPPATLPESSAGVPAAAEPDNIAAAASAPSDDEQDDWVD